MNKLFLCALLAPVSPALAQFGVTPVNLQPGAVITLPAGAAPSALAVSDFNQDGRRDVAVCQRGLGSVGVYVQLPGGGFSPDPVGTYAVGTAPTGLVALPLGDRQERPYIDLIAMSGPSDLFTLLTNKADKSGTFTATPNPVASGFPGTSPQLIVTNLNNDRYLDLVYNLDNNQGNRAGLYWRELGSPGLLKSSFTTSHFAGYPPSGFAIADFDRDNRPDFVTANAQRNELDVGYTPSGSSQPSWTSSSTERFSSGGSRPVRVAAADVNQDFLPDLIVAHELAPNIVVFLNLGSSKFGAQTMYPLSAAPRELLMADLNGDQYPEMLVLTADNKLQVFQHSRSAGESRYGTPITLATGADPTALQIADLNGDNVPDVMVGCAGDNTVRVYLNRSAVLATRAPQLAGFDVYPNPTTDQVTIRRPPTLRGPLTATLLDALGREVRRAEAAAPTTVVSVADLPRGLYVLHLAAAQGILSQRIVVR